ncbi:MAG: VOC family protein [bacterium]|nr:VOC family protein [bacterium]MCY3890635.1 VOC family protein [bacterium]
MLTAGIDHVATITKDSDRLQRFYVENFGASIEFDGPELPGGPRMTIINIGPDCEFNVFEIEGNTEADNQTPMYGRGRIDHIGLLAASLEEFSEIRERLMAAGATDGIVTVFGRKLSLFFRDPDRMECEVLVANPDFDPKNVTFGEQSARFQ